MARLLLALSLVVSVALPAKAMDSIGMIVAETGIGCVSFVVATDAGYSLLMWDGGATRTATSFSTDGCSLQAHRY